MQSGWLSGEVEDRHGLPWASAFPFSGVVELVSL
jgi:hypothetical protein